MSRISPNLKRDRKNKKIGKVSEFVHRLYTMKSSNSEALSPFLLLKTKWQPTQASKAYSVENFQNSTYSIKEITDRKKKIESIPGCMTNSSCWIHGTTRRSEAVQASFKSGTSCHPQLQTWTRLQYFKILWIHHTSKHNHKSEE